MKTASFGIYAKRALKGLQAIASIEAIALVRISGA
jgi:hypothetical protein